MSIRAARAEGASRDIPVLQTSLVRAAAAALAAFVLAVFPAKWNGFAAGPPATFLAITGILRRKSAPGLSRDAAGPAKKRVKF
jgi:hypothetical protein